MIAVRVGQNDAGELVWVAVDREVPRGGELFVIVFALGRPAVDGIDIATGLDLEEVARAGDSCEGSMELEKQGHSGVSPPSIPLLDPCSRGLMQQRYFDCRTHAWLLLQTTGIQLVAIFYNNTSGPAAWFALEARVVEIRMTG